MLSIDYRVGKVMTTVTLFVVAAAILYLCPECFLHFAALASIRLLA